MKVFCLKNQYTNWYDRYTEISKHVLATFQCSEEILKMKNNRPEDSTQNLKR